VYNGTSWFASTLATGSYAAITGDLANPGGLFGVAADAGLAIPDTKKCIDNTHVECGGFVTGYFDNYFYVCTPARIGGIRVSRESHTAVEGAFASITGDMSTLSSGERYIKATSVSLVLNNKLMPFYMSNRSIGGGAFLDLLSGIGQVGVAGGLGLNNVGMLVKTGGKVTDVAGYDTLHLTDGSGSPIECVDPWGFVSYTVRASDYLAVTGVVSMGLDTYLNPIPVLLLTDLRIMQNGGN